MTMSMKRRAAVVALFAAGCSDLGSAPRPTVEVRVASANVRPGSVIEVIVPGGIGTTAPVPATLGGAAMSFVPTSESTLVSIVPDVEAGDHELRAHLDAATGVGIVAVLSAPLIGAPATHAEQILDDYAAGFPIAPPDGVSSDAWAKRRATLDSIISEAKARIAALSADEQLAIARMLAGFAASSGAGAAFTSVALDLNPCSAATVEALRASIAASISGGALLVFLTAHGTGVIQAAGVAVSAAALYAAGTAASVAWARVGMECARQESIGISEWSSSSVVIGAAVSAAFQPLELQRGIVTPVRVEGAFRPVSRADASGNPALAEALSWLDKVIATFDLFPTFVRDLIGSPPAGPPAVAGDAMIRAVEPTRVTIENVTPTSVTLAAEPSGDVLLLTASTTSGAETPFTFDIVSADARVRATISAIIPAAAWTGRFTGTSVESGGTYTWSITMDAVQEGNAVSGVVTGVDITGDGGTNSQPFSAPINGATITFQRTTSIGTSSTVTLTLSDDMLSGTQVAVGEDGTQLWNWKLARQP